MKGWGRVVFLVSAGIFTFAGCGGRTGMLGDDVYDPDDAGGSSGSTGTGGTKATAGKPAKGGKASGGAVSTGGVGPFPVGGVSPVGGTAAGGSFPSAGFPSFGGSFPIAGAFPGGGFGGGVADECQSCIFSTCNTELTQCFQDLGCISIFACAATSGCQGFDCYTPETCAGVIDQWGGFGSPSMKAMLRSVSCVVTSGCPCN